MPVHVPYATGAYTHPCAHTRCRRWRGSRRRARRGQERRRRSCRRGRRRRGRRGCTKPNTLQEAARDCVDSHLYTKRPVRRPCPRRKRASQTPTRLDMTDYAHPSVREHSEVRTSARDTRHARAVGGCSGGSVQYRLRLGPRPPLERTQSSAPFGGAPFMLARYSQTPGLLRVLGTRGVFPRHWATAAVLTLHRVLRPRCYP